METLNVHYKGFPINKITVRDVDPHHVKNKGRLCVFVCALKHIRIFIWGDLTAPLPPFS
jgi:hypothetical protein